MSAVVVGVMLIGLIIGVSDARADDEIVAKVPFAFTIGTTHFTPGNYIVRAASEDLAVVEIVNAEHTEAMFVLTIAATDEPNSNGSARLVFTKVGGDYSLARMISANGVDREILAAPRLENHEATGAGR